MGKRRKQAKLAVASTGRVELTDGESKRSGRPERSPSPATVARLERAKKAQRSSQKYHKPTWRDEQEQGRIVDEGQAITSSSEDDDPGLVETFELVDDEAEEASEDEESSEGEEGHLRRRRRGREGSDSDSDEQPTLRRAAKKLRRAKEIVLSSDGDEEVVVARTTPVASTSNSKPKAASAAKENGSSPPKRKVLVFDSIEVSPPPPTKRRANNKGTKVNPATKQPKTNIGKSRPALNPAAQETPEEERMSIALGNPQDTTDESDGEQPVKGPGSSARKRSRVSSSSDESHRSSTTNTSDGEAGDDLPLPASIAADNKRLKAKRETTLNNAALRSPRKTKTGKVRKVDTKRKLTALSQGVRDRRSGDEESDEEDFVVDDNDAIIYDTTTDEDDNEPPPTSKKQKKAAKRKGKERAVTEDEEEEEDRPVLKKKERGKGKSRKQVQRDLLATDSEEEQATRSASKPKHGKKKARRAIRSDNDDDEEEDEPVQRKKRRRRRRNSSESEEDSNNDDDDDGVDDGPDDLEILDEETVLDQKFRTLKTNESKFASLKAARDRRKASQKAVVLDSEDERPATQNRSQRGPTGSQPRFLGDPDHHSDEDDDSEDSDSDADGSGSGSGSDSSSSRRKARQSDSEGSIDDFLAEDDGNDEEVAKYRADLQMKSQGMRYYYKTYIILLVYMIIDPDRDWRREDKELRTADEKVTQELEGFLSSLVGSSAWKPKFQHVIDTRPELTVDPLDAEEAGGPCDVCTMGRARHASSLLTLFGPKYNRKTLQDLVSAEDSSAEEESDSEDENAGRKSRDKYYTFHSGGVCTMRAEFYHQLRHWAHSTRDRVVDMLKPLRREIRKLETDKMTKKQRKKAQKQMTRLKHDEASRLIRILEDGREVEQLTDRLQKEIQQACSAFARNG